MTKKAPVEITNNTFTGVHYDAKAIEAIEIIAEGMLENARGLSHLAGILSASNVKIECLLKVE